MGGKNSRHDWKLECEKTTDPLGKSIQPVRVYTCKKCPATLALVGLENKSHLAEKARRYGIADCGMNLAKSVIDS